MYKAGSLEFVDSLSDQWVWVLTTWKTRFATNANKAKQNIILWRSTWAMLIVAQEVNDGLGQNR